jgi:hypothetical protein
MYFVCSNVSGLPWYDEGSTSSLRRIHTSYCCDFALRQRKYRPSNLPKQYLSQGHIHKALATLRPRKSIVYTVLLTGCLTKDLRGRKFARALWIWLEKLNGPIFGSVSMRDGIFALSLPTIDTKYYIEQRVYIVPACIATLSTEVASSVSASISKG